jgi:hypothetical protein
MFFSSGFPVKTARTAIYSEKAFFQPLAAAPAPQSLIFPLTGVSVKPLRPSAKKTEKTFWTLDKYQ